MDKMKNMKVAIVDIETDSLQPTKIHCIVAKDLQTSQMLVWDDHNLNEFKDWSKSMDRFVMHNGVSFDAPNLNRLLGTEIKLDQIIDTLVLSQLFNPMREGGHSLQAWGKILNFPKMEQEDFTTYTEDMLEYCKNDVELTSQVYDKLSKEGATFSKKSIRMEHKVRAIIDQQERNGFALDIRKAIGLLSRLSDEAQNLEAWSKVTFDPTPVVLKTKTKLPMNN